MLSTLVDGYGSSDESEGDNDATAPQVAASAQPAPAAGQFKDAEVAEARAASQGRALPPRLRSVRLAGPPRALSLCRRCIPCVRSLPLRVRSPLQLYCRVSDSEAVGLLCSSSVGARKT